MTAEANKDLAYARTLVRYIKQIHARGGSVKREKLIRLMSQLDNLVSAGSPIVQAKTDPTEGAKFTTAETKIAAVRDWIYDNFPKHADGSWRVYSFEKDGAQTDLRFTPAQLNAFITAVDEVLSGN